MSDDFERKFFQSVHQMQFSPDDKERMYENLIQKNQPTKEREATFMKKWTLPKVAAFAAACLAITGVTAFAASKITWYESHSNGSYDYTDLSGMTSAQTDVQGKHEQPMPEFPETIGNGFAFDGGNVIHTKGKDDDGNTVGKWDDLRAIYKNSEGKSLNLEMSYKPFDDGGITPTDTRTINGITVSYDYDEYLMLPAEDEPLDPEIQNRMETDEHFYVSYGSSEVESVFYSGIHYEKDGISYSIYSSDDISEDDLFDMAEELMNE